MRKKRTVPLRDFQTVEMYAPHPNLSERINANIIDSEVEGGVYLDRLPAGAVLDVVTRNRCYRIIHRGNGDAFITGHPEYCAQPTPVRIAGSTWGGSMLKMHFIGRGMHLEFCHPVHRTVTTSAIVEIHARPAA